jgi:hypothetical protein
MTIPLRVLWIHETKVLSLKRGTAVNLIAGIVLLIIGLAMVFVGRPNRDGMSPRFMTSSLLMLYPVFCLVFIAFGVALIISRI